MKSLVLALAFFILVPVVYADTLANIELSGNGYALNEITLTGLSGAEFVSYSLIQEPISIEYEGTYYIQEDPEGHLLILEKQSQTSVVFFSLLFEDALEKRNGYVYRSLFEGPGQIFVNITLPEGYYLSGEPSTTPAPDAVTSDGKRITLSFSGNNELQLAVFMDTNSVAVIPFVIAFALAGIGIGFFLFFQRKKSFNRKIGDLLSPEEQKVIAEIRKGTEIQKEIAGTLDFSKSKMSKIVRKLEEKNLITRSPHFKTNKLKIKK